jgi:hypothetical protein
MFRFLSLFLLATALTGAGRGETADVPSIRNTTLGFNHQFRNRYWTPLQVEIENPGPARQAVLVIESANPAATASPRVSQPVWLPANSRRFTWLSVLPELADPPTGKPKTGTTIPTLFQARLTDGALKVWDTATILGKPSPENSLGILTADARQTTYRFAAEFPATGNRRPVSRFNIQPADLPARAVDYDSIQLLVLGDLGGGALHEMQRQAITDWVQAGGILVIPATAHLPGLLHHADFLTLDRLATEPRLTPFGAPPLFPNGIHYRRLQHRTGQVLLGDAHSPLILAHRHGLGQVVTLAFDTGDRDFQRWPGAQNFLDQLLELTRQAPPPADRYLERAPGTDTLLSRLAGIKVPGRGVILLYLAGVVLGLSLILGAFRCTRAPERGWWVATALALVTGGGAIAGAHFWKSQPEPFLNEINLIFTSRDPGPALAQTALGLYSPQAAKFDLTGPRETLRLRPRAETCAIELHDTLRLPGLAVRAHDLRALFGQAPLPGVAAPAARAELTGHGLTLVVTNPTRQTLEDCFLKIHRLVVPLGDLPAGTEKTFRELTGADTFSARTIQSSTDALRARLRRLFFPDPVYTLGRQSTAAALALRQPRLEDWSPAVYGWTSAPVFPLETAQPVARRSVNLWAIETPVTYPGPRCDLPRGFLPMRLLSLEARHLERADGRYSGTRAAEIVVEFRLPAECPDVRVDRAAVALEFRGTAFRHSLAVVAPDGKRRARLDGSVIPNPGQWYNPVTRSFTIAVAIEALSPEMTAVNYWQIRELDMELGGTAL